MASDDEQEENRENPRPNYIVFESVNDEGNVRRKYRDGSYSYQNYSNGQLVSFYVCGANGINHYHDLRNPELSWFEDNNTGISNRTTPHNPATEYGPF